MKKKTVYNEPCKIAGIEMKDPKTEFHYAYIIKP